MEPRCIVLQDSEIQGLLEFMARTTMKGVEVPAYNDLMTKIQNAVPLSKLVGDGD